MKAILLSGVFAVVALTVTGAPTHSEGEQQQYVSQQQLDDYLRQRRSQYSPQYVSPCAAASAMQYHASSGPVPTFAAAPYQGYTVPQYRPYAVPHYRSVEEQEQELLGFSDMDRFMQEPAPMARLGGYGAAPAAAVAPGLSVAGRGLNQATTGTALGIFPNANVGGCSVPLLFSCSPTIAQGHIVESQAHDAAPVSAGAVNSYRLVDEPVHHDVHDKHEELLTNEHMNLSPVHETSHVTHQ